MECTEEEKQAIQSINSFKSIKLLYGEIFVMHLEQLKKYQTASEVILNLLEKQQKEIEEKDKLLKFNKNYINQLEQDLFENASNYVVPKEAIREKIKKLQNDNNKINNEMINCTNIIKMQVLDELLRGE